MTTKARNGRSYPAPALGILFLAITSFVTYVSAKILYLIRIEKQAIIIKGLFKRKHIESSDIRSINLFSKESFHWTAGTITIGTRIELLNGEIIIIADPFYRNINLIKTVLKENFKEKIQLPLFEKQIHSTQIDLEGDFEKFAGNPHTSFNGIMLYSILILFLVLIFNSPSLKTAQLALLFPAIIFYLGFGMQLNYFLVSNKHLLIRNHFLFWVNKTYNINDIAAADFETPYRRSNALRVITKDFKSKLFCAGSLRDKKWGELKEKLKSLEINFVE